MAKQRRGRLPVARGRATFFLLGDNEIAQKKSDISQKTYEANFKVIYSAFRLAKRLKSNDAINLIRYLLRMFDLEVETSVEIEGAGYDYTVWVRIENCTLELIQNKNKEALAA